MASGEKLVPVKITMAGYREIDIPVKTSIQGLVRYDVPVKTTFGALVSKDVPVKTTIYVERVDYGLYGESIWETAPRETFFYAQGGTPDKSVAVTDPYWFIKSGTTETGKEGFMEMGFGQNDAHNQTDTNLTGFVRVQLDGTSGEGEVKIKPCLWFYPSSEPTTDQEGMMYYDSVAQEFKFYNGAAWGALGGGGGTVSGTGTAGTIAKWSTGGTSIEDSVITESGGNIAMSGDLTVTGGNIGAGAASVATNALYGYQNTAADFWIHLDNDYINRGCYIKASNDNDSAGGVYAGFIVATAGTVTQKWNMGMSGSINWKLRDTINTKTCIEVVPNTGDTTILGDLTVSGGNIISANGLWTSLAGAQDGYIWAVSGAYPNYGLYYNTGSPDYMEWHWIGAVKAAMDMETGSLQLAGDLAVNGGDITCSTDLKITPTGYLLLNPTTYVQLKSAAATSMYFDCGSIFQFRDRDAADAVVAEIASTTGRLTVGVATHTTDPIELLKFRTERSWSFRKRGTTSSARLALESDVASKYFWIGYDDGVIYAAKFQIEAVQTDCTVQLAHDVTVDGNLDVDGGTIEIENSFEIEYNSTSDSLDFNYIG